jgi:hypothetical protein
MQKCLKVMVLLYDWYHRCKVNSTGASALYTLIRAVVEALLTKINEIPVTIIVKPPKNNYGEKTHWRI